MDTKDSTPGSKPADAVVFGDCMWNRHEYCKTVSSAGRKCPCKCENHGSKYVAPDLDTPLHKLLMEIGTAFRAGKTFDVNSVKTDTPVIELKYQEPLKTKEEENAADTIEELEAKRE